MAITRFTPAAVAVARVVREAYPASLTANDVRTAIPVLQTGVKERRVRLLLDDLSVAEYIVANDDVTPRRFTFNPTDELTPFARRLHAAEEALSS